MILLSEYQNNTYNARVYLNDKGKYSALLYDVKFFDTEEDAENCAENWVLKHHDKSI